MLKDVRRSIGRIWRPVALAVVMTAGGMPASAQDYPTRPVKILVPVAPGGPMDMLARMVGERLRENWGQSVITENRAGGGQVIATQAAAKAPADGYTLLLMGHVYTMNPWLFSSLPYAPDDLVPVSFLAETPLILVVNPNLPVRSVVELIDYAKKNPGKLSFGSSGPSSSLRFAGELLKSMAGINMVHVPYKGNGPMTMAVVSGEMDVGFVSPVSLPFIKDGRLRALAITSRERSANLPDLPTVAESGVPGYEAGSWFGMMAPKGVPDQIIRKINADIDAILKRPEIQQQMVALDVTPKGGNVTDFARHIDAELEKWRVLIQKMDIKIQ